MNHLKRAVPAMLLFILMLSPANAQNDDENYIGIPPEILSITEQLALITDVVIEYKKQYIASHGTLNRTHRFIKMGSCWRDEWREDGRLKVILSFDGEKHYHYEPDNNYLLVTDNPNGSKITAVTIHTGFMDNPLYGWAGYIFSASNTRLNIPELTDPQFWISELGKYSIQSLGEIDHHKKVRFVNDEATSELTFKVRDDGQFELKQQSMRSQRGNMDKIPVVQTDMSDWKDVPVGNSVLHLPMRIARTFIYPDGLRQAGDSFTVIPGSIRPLPEHVTVNAFRIPLSSVPNPVVVESWPPKTKKE